MNMVGIHGKGESVWLAFFLHAVLTQFAPLAREHGDSVFEQRCITQAAQLRTNIELHAWDGAWYRRAWFDDGAPLGAATNDECRIDSIAQSWSVLSHGGDPQHARTAMSSLEQHLVKRESGVIQLLDPPFDKSTLEPGYIKGYVPGVRENGGQYTHAAIWALMAYAELGEHGKAWDLFAMINPINHARSSAAVATYKVEPYVIAADVYAVAPHTGRGGWTWYTGSAGWTYRLLIESLLGIRREGTRLRLSPRLPPDYKSVTMNYRYYATVYQIKVTQSATATQAISVTFDGKTLEDNSFVLNDDQIDHVVEVKLATASA